MALTEVNFTGNNGDPLPSPFTEESGSNYEIFNNAATSTAQGSHGAIASVDSGDANGIVEADILKGTDSTAGVAFRIGSSFSYCYAEILESASSVRFRKCVNGSYQSFGSGAAYAIPNYDQDAVYRLRIEMRDDEAVCLLNGTPILAETDSYNNTRTRHGLRLAPGVSTADNFAVGDSAELPAIGDIPVLVMSGDPVTNLVLNDPEPVFTVVSATDTEDGTIDPAGLIATGDTIDNTTAGSYTRRFTIQDTDGNFAAEITRVVNYTAVPLIEITGYTRLAGNPVMSIREGQPFVPPVAKFYEDNGKTGFVPYSNFDPNANNAAGDYEIWYDYTDANGIAAERKIVSLTILPALTITDTSVYSMVQQYGAESIQVDGYTLKRFDAPDGLTWGYGFENDVTIPASDISLLSNDSIVSRQVAKFEVPFDSLSLCKQAEVSIEIDTDSELDGSRIEILFGEFRIADKYRIRKNATGTKTILEFVIKPYHDSNFRLLSAGNGHDADRYMQDTGQFHDFGLSANTDIYIHYKFATADNTVSITNVNASIIIGKAVFNEGGSFLRGKDNFLVPYRPDDALNKGVPDNAVMNLPFYCNVDGDTTNPQLLTIENDPWITVGDASGARVGDLCLIAAVYTAVFPDHNTFNSKDLSSAVGVTRTKNVLGNARYVAEVDLPNNRIRMTLPALITYNSKDDEPVLTGNRVYCLACLSAETASFRVGDEEFSWSSSITNGMDKRDNRGLDYVSVTDTHIIDEIMDLENFRLDFILPQNNWGHPFMGNLLASQETGERVGNSDYQLPTPDDYVTSSNMAFNPDRNHYFEYPNKWQGMHQYYTRDRNVDDGFIRSSRPTFHDLSQWSVAQLQWRPERNGGMTNSPRASGISGAAMIRKEELDTITYRGLDPASIQADLTVAENAIQHAIVGYSSSCQLQSKNYLADVDDPTTTTDYFMHEPYNSPLVVVNGGSGYAVGNVLHFRSAVPDETHSPTIYAVEAVDGNGAITKAFMTRTGQHKVDITSTNMTPSFTDGSGTGAIFDSTGLFSDTANQGNVMAYPGAIADGGFANTYAGAMPMGATFSIPKSINLREEWERGATNDAANLGYISDKWSYEFYAMAVAIQKYGWVLCDVTANTSAIIIHDYRITGKQRSRMFDSPFANYANITRLRRMMTAVENFTPTHHLTTNEDFEPDIELIGKTNIAVPNDWQDPGADVLSSLHGYDTAFTSSTIDRDSRNPQTIEYQYTDASGNTSQTISRVITLQDPVVPNTVVVTVTGLADGMHFIKLWRDDTNVLVFQGEREFTNGQSTVPVGDLPVGTVLIGRYLLPESPEAGTGLYTEVE